MKTIEELRAGEDLTPVEEGVWMTPGQMWHALLEMSEEERMEKLEGVIFSLQEYLHVLSTGRLRWDD